MPIVGGIGREVMVGDGFVVIKQPNASWVKISGITKDATGAPLPFCDVDLIYTVNDVTYRHTQSDATGAYAFDVMAADGPFYVVAYKAGAPDVAGTSVNTLVGVFPNP